MKRRILVVSIITLFILVTMYSALWLHISTRMTDAWTDMRTRLAEAGWNTTASDITISGFPGIMTLDTGRVETTHSAGDRIAVDALRIRLRPWAPLSPSVHFHGPVTITKASGNRYRILADDLSLAIRTTASGEFASVHHGIRNLVLENNDGNHPVTVSRLDLYIRITPEPDSSVWTGTTPAGHASLTLNGLEARGKDGIRVPVIPEDFSLDLQVRGLVPTSGSLTERLDAWRSAGGAVDINRLDLKNRNVRLHANGTLALDARLQPEAALAVQVNGTRELPGTLLEHHIIRPAEAAVLRLALTGLERRQADGTQHLALPLTLQDSIIHVGPLKVARIPEILWTALISP